MEKIFKAFLTAIIHTCVILGHHTILSSSDSSNLNGTSNAIIDHNDHHNNYHQQERHEPPHHYTDQWAVHIEGGHEVANQLADKHGFINTGQILPDYYHFVHRKVAKRSIEPCHEYHQALSAEPEVRWHAQQIVKRRSKRDFLQLNGNGGRPPFTLSSSSVGSNRRSRRNQITFNDPRWPVMWYLNRGAGLDMNVQEAWAEGITGKGIVVTILDDGLEKDHPDIIQNYDPLASFDVNSLDNDPMPTYDLTDSNRHGTRCAGEVAAEANNSLCAVGIAYEASVGGIRMLDGDVTDAVEARSLSHMPQHIDIFSASWGPDDDGKTVDGPGELATRAFLEGITKGRQGKGSIFVWASGNGGRDHDNCNCDGYTNSIWTLSISSATENGLVPWYSEACSSTLATTYSSGGNGEKQIVTIDLHHSCTSSHTGTSASAPLAAGICALALQANTNLTWRDMQHIVVRTARPANLIAPDWLTNGVGRNVSHSFGYGLMDAGAMVKLAKRWKTVPDQNKCEVRAPYTDKNIPAKSKVTLDLKVTECPGVNLLEHVQAKVTLTSGRRGDLQIYLVSPQGTRSTLLAHRRHDLNRSGFTDWPFMSVHTWGESPIGKWTLEIHNEGRFADHKNGRTVLKKWSLILYGTGEDINANISLTSDDKKRSEKEKGETAVEDQLSSTLPPTEQTTNKSQTTEEASKSLPERNNTQLEVGVPTIVRKPARQRFRPKTVQKKTQKGVNNSEALRSSNNESTATTCNGTCSNRSPLTNTAAIGDKNTELTTTTTSTTSTRPTTLIESIPKSSTPAKEDFSTSSSTTTSSTRSSPTSILPSTSTSATLEPTTAVTNATGKLQTWTLVAHGITANPNDDQSTDKNHGTMEFDGSDNKIVLEPSQVQRNQQISVHSIPNVSDGGDSVHRVSPSRAASLQYPGCLKFSMSMVSPGMCVVCEPELYLQDFKCVAMCSNNFYPDANPSTGARVCLPCHYTCLTCFGGEETQCLSCHEDSTLRTSHRTEVSDENGSKGRRRHETVQTTYKESHCYPTALLSTIDGNDMWYKALLMGVIVNVAVVVFLIFYIWLQKQRERRHNINAEFIRDSGAGNDDGGSDRDPAALGSSWLSLNRKAYSRVAPQDNDLDDELENDVFTPLKHQTSQVPSHEAVDINNGINKLGVGFKIAIPPLITMASNNNISPRKFAQSEKERLRLSIPLQHLTNTTDLLSPS